MLTDSWTQVFSGTAPFVQTFTVPRAIPAGRLLVMALGRAGGASSITNIGNVRGNVWSVEKVGVHTTNTLNVALATLLVGTPLVAGDTFSVTYNATANRWAAAFGVFNDVLTPISKVVIASAVSTAATPVNCGPTPNLAVDRALVLTAAATTANGYPFINSGNKIAAQTVTVEGSSDRGVALLFKNEGGYPHTGSFALSSSVVSVSVTAAFKSASLPPGTLPLMTANGEVPGVLSHWNGSVEVPVTSQFVT